MDAGLLPQCPVQLMKYTYKKLAGYDFNLYIASASGTFSISFPVKFDFLIIPVFI